MNQHYKKLRALIAILTDEEALDDLVFEAMERAKTPVSKSKLQGWRVSSEHKNYRRMSQEDLLDVLDALTQFYNASKLCQMCGYYGPDWIDDGETCPKCKLVQ